MSQKLTIFPPNVFGKNLFNNCDINSPAQMDKHGIGTDATHAEHIETVKQRQYIGITNNDKLIPGSNQFYETVPAKFTDKT
jgi:reverse gyrase